MHARLRPTPSGEFCVYWRTSSRRPLVHPPKFFTSGWSDPFLAFHFVSSVALVRESFTGISFFSLFDWCSVRMLCWKLIEPFPHLYCRPVIGICLSLFCKSCSFNYVSSSYTSVIQNMRTFWVPKRRFFLETLSLIMANHMGSELGGGNIVRKNILTLLVDLLQGVLVGYLMPLSYNFTQS